MDSKLEWPVMLAELSTIGCPAVMDGGLMSVEPVAWSTHKTREDA